MANHKWKDEYTDKVRQLVEEEATFSLYDLMDEWGVSKRTLQKKVSQMAKECGKQLYGISNGVEVMPLKKKHWLDAQESARLRLQKLEAPKVERERKKRKPIPSVSKPTTHDTGVSSIDHSQPELIKYKFICQCPDRTVLTFSGANVEEAERKLRTLLPHATVLDWYTAEDYNKKFGNATYRMAGNSRPNILR